MIFSNFTGIAGLNVVKAESIIIISEAFDNGNNQPDGWTFSGGISKYTSNSSSGENPPSLKLGGTGQQVITPTFNLPSRGKLSFWIKGNGTNADSHLLVEMYNGSNWDALEDIKPLPSSEETKTYDIESDITQIRFTYTKSAGNVAFDDVLITSNGGTEAPVSLTSLSLAKTLELEVGKTDKLSLTYEPANTTEKDVEWKSLDETVATVAQVGTVTAVKKGTATIEVVSKANSNIKAQCEVTVTEAAPVALLSIGEARKASPTTIVTTKGIVTRKSGNNYYIQDDSAAICIYQRGLNFNEGDEVQVTGEIKDYNGLLEIVTLSDNKVISTGNKIPTPQLVTIDKVNEELESELVKIEKVTIGVINTSKNTTLEDENGKTINIFKVPSLSDIKEGDVVNVTAVVGEYNGKYQLTVAKAEDVVLVDLGPDTVAPVIVHTAQNIANVLEDLNVSAMITDDRQVAEAKVYYRTKGQTSFKEKILSGNAAKYSTIIPKEELDIAGLEYYIEATDGTNTSRNPLVGYYEVTISNIDTYSPIITNVLPQEGTATGKDLRPVISADYSDDSGIDVSSVKMTLDEKEIEVTATESKVEYTPSQDLSEGTHTVYIEVLDTKGNKATKQWSFTVGEQEYNFYFGELHSHTNLSDGAGTLDDAYTWARDNAKADFFAVTDHSNWFDNDTEGSFFIDDDPSKGENDSSVSNKWVQGHVAADKYNKENEFVAIYGFEMTWSGSTGGWGHINTFNTKGFETRSNRSVDLKTYYNRISKLPNSISQLNHPGKTFGDFADFGYYSEEADNVVNLVEVGNGEGPVRGSGYFPSYEYYTRALDKGWHVAPTNNEDNHKGGWVNSNTARTVVLAETLTRDSIYDAMRNRRVYATEDENLQIMFKTNNAVMGSYLNNPEKLNMVIDINDPDSTDKIGKVSIISNGGTIVDSKTFDTNNAHWELNLDPQYNYYYIRVDQNDKDIAVSAPVWTGESIPVGISKVTASQSLAVVNDKIEISTELFNNKTDFTLPSTKVEFYVNEVEEGNKIGEATTETVSTGNTSTAKIDWTATKPGNYTIYAVAKTSIEGKDKVFTGSVKVSVKNKEDIVKVVIDGGHQNQYVTGNYAGKIEGLKAMLTENDCVTLLNEDELTAEDLKDAKLLIITDPQSTDDTKYNVMKSVYTDAEVEVIKAFVAAGGNLIITSKADYKDGDGEYSNGAQVNKILEAIETNLRVNDDEVIDNTNNGGSSYRLVFDDYVGSKYGLTDGIPEGETYSFYSGSSVILKEGGDGSKVDWLVKGHDTTETMDADKDGDNTPVAKGQVYALAAEELSNGAKIIVSGTTFFSDFEISGDNQNSNIKITNNILEWMASPPPAELKTIAEVRKDENKDGIPDYLGKKFAIEGIVTAQSEAIEPKNAFFEVIYLQDETGGITIFGVSQTPVKLGQKVRVEGYVDEYQGDAEIQISDETKGLTILDEKTNILNPKEMSTKDSMLEENEGWLVKIQGTVTNMNSQNIYVNDGTGEARAYVEGYIGDNKGENRGKWDSSIKVGDTVSIIGLASEDPEGHRLRIRNTSEIVKIADKPTVVSVSGVTLNKSEATLEVGETLQLNAEIAPENATNKNVTWTSSNTKIATVSDNGLVTALKSGTTTITVTTADGNKTVTCKIKVTEKEEPQTGDDSEEKPQVEKSLDKQKENKVLLKVGDREVEVVIPEAAISSNGILAIEEVSLDDVEINNENSVISKLYEFTIDGEGYKFNKPITISIKVDADEIKGVDTKNLRLAYYDEANSKWIVIGGSEYKDGKVIGKVTHFSKYAVVDISKLPKGYLVQTGSPIDTKALIIIGIALLAAGLFIAMRKKEKMGTVHK